MLGLVPRRLVLLACCAGLAACQGDVATAPRELTRHVPRALGSISANTQPGLAWVLRTDVGTPAWTFRNVAATFDAALGVVVLFSQGQTWEYDGDRWTQVATSTVPQTSNASGGVGRWNMTYDSGRQVVVLVGSGDPVRTWEYDGTDWREIDTPTRPEPRGNVALAYDASAGRTVLFGGWAPTNLYVLRTDTWVYDGETWTQLPTNGAPPGRFSSDMVYSSELGGVVLHGGFRRYPFGTLSDTWILRGNQWTHLTDGPSREFPRLVAPPGSEYVYLLGGSEWLGQEQTFARHNDLWELQGASWNGITAANMPPVLTGPTVVFDTKRWRIVVVGGQLGDTSEGASYDTWELPLATQVAIDIKPGSETNPVNCSRPSTVIPVAILSTQKAKGEIADFDATTVDQRTVTFEGAHEIDIDNPQQVLTRHEEDVDGDGDIDLVLQFRYGDTQLSCGSTVGYLAGETFDGRQIRGSGPVHMIGN